MSSRRTLIFVHIPKTAGTSVWAALRHARNIRLDRSHEPATKVRTTYVEKEWDNAVRATFIRNPWDRAVSLYWWWDISNKSGVGFNTWIKHGCKIRNDTIQTSGFDPLLQLPHFTDAQGNDLVNFIGRYENLQQDTEALGGLIGVEPTHLVRMQMSNRPKVDTTHGYKGPRGSAPRVPYQELFTKESAEILAEQSQEFIERFGYTFD